MPILDRKLFIWLFLTFIAAAIIGTIAHEFGHYIVARSYGYNVKLSYASTHYNTWPVLPLHRFYIRLGGPAQTMLTGSIGFLLLFIYRRSFLPFKRLSTGQWVMIFLSLFWLRQIAVFFIGVVRWLVSGKFSSRGDEIQIARFLNLSDWTILSLTAAIGAGILAIVIFKFIPRSQRYTFILAGLAGGITGYLVWFVLLGKYILP